MSGILQEEQKNEILSFFPEKKYQEKDLTTKREQNLHFVFDPESGELDSVVGDSSGVSSSLEDDSSYWKKDKLVATTVECKMHQKVG